MTLRLGSLCSGYSGLEMGVHAVLGGTTAWVSDVDPGACKILAHRYPEVPNLGDMTTVDWVAVEPVDVIVGGTPCQDVSAAGKRAGMRAGTRSGLWASMCDAIDIIRPGLVVWENVRGVLSASADSSVESCPICVGDERESYLRALGRVLGDLADIGYDASWQGLRAADVGAPHGRFRVFVTAWPAQDPHVTTRGQRWLSAPGQAEGWRARADTGGRDRAPAAHTSSDGRHEGWAEPARLVGGPDAALGGDAAADAVGLRGERRGGHGDVAGPSGAGEGHEGEWERYGDATDDRGAVAWGDYEPAVRRWERLTRPAPSPVEPGKTGQPRLSPAFVEWMQGLPAGWVTDVPGLTRNEQLKALGNGVVPQQCAAALRLLLAAERSAAA